VVDQDVQLGGDLGLQEQNQRFDTLTSFWQH
jgi:hypothetical protein